METVENARSVEGAASAGGLTERELARVVRRVPACADVVVECGCGEGALGAWFQRRHPGCRWYGFDAAEDLLASAAARLYAVGRETAATLQLSAYGISSVDVLIYGAGEVAGLSLAVLRAHLCALSARGVVLLRLPEATAERNALMGLVRAAGMVPAKSWQAPAMVACVRPAARQPGLIVQTALGERIACARPRVLEPDEFLASDAGAVTQIVAKGIDVNMGRRFPVRIFVRQRLQATSVAEYRKMIDALREHHYLVLLELDDDPERWHEAYARTRYIDFIGAHAIQVSTEALARRVRQWNPHVYVFRNHIKELPPLREEVVAEHGDTVTIFFGALNREGAYEDILAALNAAASRYGSRLRFLVLSDRRFYEALATEAKEFIGDPHVYGGKFVPYETYCAALDRADISLLPLNDTPFNRCKSDLKFIESAAHGTVVLASPTVYAETVVDGCTGFLYHSPQEFAEKLRLLVEQPQRRQAMARSAYDYVKRERLQYQHYGERIAAYREMAAQYDTLERELRERLARLERGER